MRRSSCVGLLVLLALVTLAVEPLTPSQDPSPFRAGATLVPIDVRVVDRAGAPVTDLLPSEFTVLEDEVPQRLAHFSSQKFVPQPPPAAAGVPGPAQHDADFTPNRVRTFLIVLGRGRLQPPSKGVDAMLHLVQSRLLPQDQVAVLAWNRATDFGTDRAPVIEVLERFRRAHEGIETQIVLWERSIQSLFSGGELPPDIQRDIDDVFGGPRATRALDGGSAAAERIRDERTRNAVDAASTQPDPGDRTAVRRLGGDLDAFLNQSMALFHDVTALYLGVEYLRHLPGEKHLVFVSEFGVSLRGVDGDRSLGRLAADARVVLDIIHAGGVPFGWSGLVPAPAGLGMPQAMTARNLAQLTGGSFFAHRFASAAMDVDAIDAATRFAYVLGYYPSNSRWDGKYRKIAVRVNRPGVTVLHRDGYFGQGDAGPLERRNPVVFSRVASAAAFDRTIRDLPVTAERAVVEMTGATGEVRVDISVDLSRASVEQAAGRHRTAIEVAVFCGDRRDELVGESWQTLELEFDDASLAEIKQSGLKHTARIAVTGLPRTAKVVVYDHGSGLIGTNTASVDRAK